MQHMKKAKARSTTPMRNSEGKYVRVKVRAGARKESFEQKSDSFVICVKEPAEGNRANARVIALIARHFRVPERSVRILTGHRSPSKKLLIPQSIA